MVLVFGYNQSLNHSRLNHRDHVESDLGVKRVLFQTHLGEWENLGFYRVFQIRVVPHKVVVKKIPNWPRKIFEIMTTTHWGTTAFLMKKDFLLSVDQFYARFAYLHSKESHNQFARRLL